MAFLRTEGPEGMRLALSPAYYRTRSAIMGLTGLALGSLFCCIPIGVLADGPVDEGGEFLVLFALVGILLAIIVPVLAAFIALESSSLAARSVVRIANGQLFLHDGRTLALGDIERFELGRAPGHGWLLTRGWPMWLAIDTGGQTHALSEGVHPLLDGKRTARTLKAVSEQLGKTFVDRSQVFDLNISAPACYLPIGGVFLPASVATLIFGADPKTRFAAKQSLLHLVCTFAVAILLGGVCVATFSICDLIGISPALTLAPGGLLMFAMFMMSLVLRLYAVYRSWKDPLWVMPWLARVTGPWAKRVLHPDPLSF